MNHGLSAYRLGCKCILCRAANSDYRRRMYLARAKGESNLVPINRARQLLLQFESSCDAARVVKINQSTVSRIINKKVKKIRIQTERKIVARAA
jgi:DNA invertase Pin-like site-specific DNA recombinase